MDYRTALILIMGLIIYTLKFSMFLLEALYEFSLCRLAEIFEKLLDLRLPTRIVTCVLIMGTSMMLVSSFDSPTNYRTSRGPLELETHAICKPIAAYEYSLNSEWTKLNLERTDDIKKNRKEVIHFVVSLANENGETKSMQHEHIAMRAINETEKDSTVEKTSNEVEQKEMIEDIEKEVFVVDSIVDE